MQASGSGRAALDGGQKKLAMARIEAMTRHGEARPVAIDSIAAYRPPSHARQRQSRAEQRKRHHRGPAAGIEACKHGGMNKRK